MEATTVPTATTVPEEAQKVTETPLRGVPKLNIDINVRTAHYERLAEHEGVGLEALIQTLNTVLQKLNPEVQLLLVKAEKDNGNGNGEQAPTPTAP